MDPPSNRKGNSKLPPPPEAERLKAEHGLSWHPRGGWCKVFRGDANRTYFGRLPAAEAVRLCVLEEQRRLEGRAAEARLTTLTLRDAVNLYLTHLDQQLASGAIGPEQRASYGQELHALLEQVGRSRRLVEFTKLTAPESLFRPLRAAALERGVYACEKHVVQVRTFLDWCSTTRRFIPAPFYADAFSPPTDKEKRAATKGQRRAKGTATWSVAEVLEIVAAARTHSVHRYAQVLLMLNGGMGSGDLSLLEDADVDWERQCIHTERSKTLVPRVIPLWPVTLEAMRASRAQRPAPAAPEYAGRFFLRRNGTPIVLEQLDAAKRRNRRRDSLKNWFYRLLNAPDRTRWKAPAARLRHLKRHRAGAYTLRSVFAVLSLGHGQDRNLEAVVLGQQFDRPVLEYYLRGDLREKLVAVVDHVRRQLWPADQ